MTIILKSRTEVRLNNIRVRGAEALKNARKARAEGRDDAANFHLRMAKHHARILRRMRQHLQG